MYDALYESIRSSIEKAALASTPTTTIENFRHISHDATFEVMAAAARMIRELETVELDTVLLVFGERP